MSLLSSPLLLIGLHLLSLLFAATSAAVPPGSTSPTAACRTSVYPKLCRALLSLLQFPGDSYSLGQYSVKQALKQARRTSDMLDRLLSPGGTSRSRRIGGGAGARALDDCRQLVRLSAGYLEEVQAMMGKGERALSGTEAEHVRALMSALVTNQQTCFDGLEAAAAASRAAPSQSLDVLAPLVNASKVYCVSLELVTSALSLKGRNNPGMVAGFAPGLHNQGLGRLDGRHLAEGTEDRALEGVRINGTVLVAKDGSGNFTTISDAIAAAPNGTDVVKDGYFKIVYEENVLVGKQKKNLILVGAGMNRTVITGNPNSDHREPAAEHHLPYDVAAVVDICVAAGQYSGNVIRKMMFRRRYHRHWPGDVWLPHTTVPYAGGLL